MKPFFSVIIPTLNEEKFLPKLLNDLEHQKEKDFEVIIVDGKSTDNTLEEVKKYKNKFKLLKIIISDKRNLCYQRNLGAKHSNGEYLIFMDADVRVFKNYLHEIKKTIDRKSYLFLTTYQLPDTKDDIDMFLTQIGNYSLEILRLIDKQMAPGYNFIIFRDVFHKIGGFNEETTISEDHDLSIRIGNAGVKLYILPKKLIKWSFRRIKKDGYLSILLRYGLASFYSILLGEIKNKKMGYQEKMGGWYFEDKTLNKSKNINLEIKKYLLKIKKLLKKILFLKS